MRPLWPIPWTGMLRRRPRARTRSPVPTAPCSRRLGMEPLESRLLLSAGPANSPLHGWDSLDPIAQQFEAYPVLALAQTGRNTRVIGGLNGAPNASFTLEFFAASGERTADAGAEDRSLGRFDVTTDATGHAPFNALLAGATTVGEFVRAAATGWTFTDTTRFSELVLAVAGAVAVFDSGSGELGIFGADQSDAIELSISSSGVFVLTDAAGPMPTAGGAADVHNTTSVHAALGDNNDSFSLLADNRLQGINITVSGEAGDDLATVVMPSEPCSNAAGGSCGVLLFDGGAGDGDTLQVFTSDLAEDVNVTLDGAGGSQSRFAVAVADQATHTPTGAFTALGVESLAVNTGGGDDVITADLAGNAVLTAAGAAVRLDGGAGNDTITVTATGFINGRVELFGGQGDDLLILLAPGAGTQAYLATDGGPGIDSSTTTVNVHATGFEQLDVVDLLLANTRSDQDALLVAALDSGQLQPVVDEAVGQWLGAGASISGIDVRVSNLPGTVLGMATAHGNVWIDRDAAGFGWFLGGSSATPEAGRFDLLSVLSHELGHVLGFDHSGGGVMEAMLLPSVRRLPQPRSLVEGLAQSPLDFSDGFGAMPLLLGARTEAAHSAGSDVGLVLDGLAAGLLVGDAGKQTVPIPQSGRFPVRTDALDDAFTEIGARRLADEHLLDETLLEQLAAPTGAESAGPAAKPKT